MMEDKIEKRLKDLKSHPSQDGINEAFQDIKNVVQLCFTVNQNGRLGRITDVDKMTNGQTVWTKSQIMTFPDYFYSEQFIQQEIEAAGLNIDKIENYFTEERRIAYNSSNPEDEFDKTITDDPPFVLYHLSKPLSD